MALQKRAKEKLTDTDPSVYKIAKGVNEPAKVLDSDVLKAIGNELDNNITASARGNTTILGNDGNDILYGGGYNDSISGGKGDDAIGVNTLDGRFVDSVTLDGGDGNDRIIGAVTESSGTGAHTAIGGAGDDTFEYALSYIDAGKGDDIGDGLIVRNDNADNPINAEYNFGDGSDEIKDITLNLGTSFFLNLGKGDDRVNLIKGDNALATIYGEAGNDYISMSTDNTLTDYSIDGGDGNDTIAGGDGFDTLIGGKGVDELYGGEGADKFVFIYLDESNAKTPDVIKDFGLVDGKQDVLVFGGGNDMPTLVQGNFVPETKTTAARNFPTEANSAAFDPVTQLLHYNLDGDKKIDFVIKLEGVLDFSEVVFGTM